jgi:hypothetical protein
MTWGALSLLFRHLHFCRSAGIFLQEAGERVVRVRILDAQTISGRCLLESFAIFPSSFYDLARLRKSACLPC